jgi:outer membrane protein OmpA-like peptidoglycan-associated protein
MRARTRVASAAAVVLALGLGIATVVHRERPVRVRRTSRGDVQQQSSLTVRPNPNRGAPVEASDAATLTAALAAGRVVIRDLAFIAGSDTLMPSADAVIARVAKALIAARGAFLVEAHVVPSGDMVSDQLLTDRRAAAVRARLITAGVPATRLFAMGFGATRPAGGLDSRTQSRIEISRMP